MHTSETLGFNRRALAAVSQLHIHPPSTVQVVPVMNWPVPPRASQQTVFGATALHPVGHSLSFVRLARAPPVLPRFRVRARSLTHTNRGCWPSADAALGGVDCVGACPICCVERVDSESSEELSVFVVRPPAAGYPACAL